MSTQYYTKQQVDELATIIGMRIKNHTPVSQEVATDISSFMEALDNIQTPTHFLNIPITTPIFVDTPQT